MCEESKESALLLRVMEYLEEDNWKYQRMDDKEVLLMFFRGEEATFRCIVQVDAEQGHIFFYSALESYVPSHRRDDVALFLTRANYGMRVGNFEMDLDDGEIRFKTNLVLTEEEDFPQEVLGRMIYLNLAMMNRYYPGVMRVSYADTSPEQAIAEIEGKIQESV